MEPTPAETEMAKELDALTIQLRGVAKRAKKMKRTDVWGAADDASDFTEFGAQLLRGEI